MCHLSLSSFCHDKTEKNIYIPQKMLTYKSDIFGEIQKNKSPQVVGSRAVIGGEPFKKKKNSPTASSSSCFSPTVFHASWGI
jgi:hypothetical protein